MRDKDPAGKRRVCCFFDGFMQVFCLKAFFRNSEHLDYR